MQKTWLLTANRSEAKLFEVRGRVEDPTLVRHVSHPRGRLQNREINADKPGRTFDSFGYGRHAKSSEYEPTEHVAQQFARQLAELLNKGRNNHAYQKLIIAAEPGFLGIVLEALDEHTAAMVTKTIKKELVNMPAQELPNYMYEF